MGHLYIFKPVHRDWRKPTLVSNYGATAMSALMGIAIGIIAVTSIGATISSSMKHMRALVDAAELRDIRLHLTSMTNCDVTKQAYAVCGASAASAYIGLRNSADKELVKPYVNSPNTKFGGYEVRAACVAPNKLEVQVKTSATAWGPLFKSDAPFSCVYK